jgi:hypothetical protein
VKFGTRGQNVKTVTAVAPEGCTITTTVRFDSLVVSSDVPVVIPPAQPLLVVLAVGCEFIVSKIITT